MVKGCGWACFCSYAQSDCLNVAALVLLLGFPLPISKSSVGCHLPLLLSVQSSGSRLSPAPDGICARQLSPSGHACSSLLRNFSPAAERDKKHLPGTRYLTFSWRSYVLKVKDFGLCCGSFRAHMQPQMGGALICLHHSILRFRKR